MPATRVRMGDIAAFGDREYNDAFSLNPARAIEYPVVTRARPPRFYDIRNLILWAHTSPTFPHNREPIDWLYGLDVAERDAAAELPADYVARTRAYLAAARAYAPIWTARAALSEDVKCARGARKHSAT
jgi:hypothetical protein